MLSMARDSPLSARLPSTASCTCAAYSDQAASLTAHQCSASSTTGLGENSACKCVQCGTCCAMGPGPAAPRASRKAEAIWGLRPARLSQVTATASALHLTLRAF